MGFRQTICTDKLERLFILFTHSSLLQNLLQTLFLHHYHNA